MMKKHKKRQQLQKYLIGGQTRFFLIGVHKKRKKGEQLHGNLMCGRPRFYYRAVAKQQRGEQQDRNLMGVWTRFSLIQRDDIAAKDLTDRLPKEILCRIVSFLPLREAVRTSILSREWRYLWRSSLNLNFDIINMTGKDYKQCGYLAFSNLVHRYYDEREANLLMKKSQSFVMWVNQVMELHDSGKIDFCMIDFPLDVQYSSNVDSWIQNLATKGVEELHLKLSEFNVLCQCHYELYKFPYWLFARAEGSSPLKHLALDYCDFHLTHNFNSLSNLTSLSLGNTILRQDTLDNIFQYSQIESFNAKSCFFLPSQVKIACKNGNLKLKHLNISFCYNMKELEICGAGNLSSLEYRRGFIVPILFRNSAIPVKLCFDCCSEVGLSYAFGQLAADFPQLHTLTLSLQDRAVHLPEKEHWKIPKQLQTFSKLKDAVFLMANIDPGSVLKMTIALVQASPSLQRLELHLPRVPEEITRKLPRKLHFQKLFQHSCLKKVKIFNFQGAPIQVQLGTYLLKNVTALENMTIIRRGQLYEGDGKWMEDYGVIPKITREQVLKRLIKDVPYGTQFIVL